MRNSITITVVETPVPSGFLGRKEFIVGSFSQNEKSHGTAPAVCGTQFPLSKASAATHVSFEEIELILMYNKVAHNVVNIERLSFTDASAVYRLTYNEYEA